MMTGQDGSLIKKWTIPNTEITLQLIEEGRYAGGYQFSSYTVAHAGEYYRRVKHLPYKKGATPHFADTYLTAPGNKWLEAVVNRLPDSMRRRSYGQAVWQWIGMAVVLLLEGGRP